MKNLTVKARITFYFVIFMMIIISVILSVMYIMNTQLTKAKHKEEMIEAISAATSSIGRAGMSQKDIVTYEDDVYISFYDEDGNLMTGQLPSDFKKHVTFDNEDFRIVSVAKKRWYVYDKKIMRHDTVIWVQGIMKEDTSSVFSNVYFLIIGILLPIVVLLMARGGYYIISRSFKPIDQIIETANSIGQGSDLSARIEIAPGNDEIHQLASTYNHMLERLETSFENEKQFTSDASHELRTPTTVIIAQCEYALEHATTIEETKEALTKILGQTQNMSALIAQLLMLARADKGTLKINQEQLNFSELLEMVTGELKGIADDSGITLYPLIQEDIYVSGDETLLIRLCMNVIENAIHYNHPDGSVLITLSKHETTLDLQVLDDGTGIKEENLSKIFDRFYQEDASRTTSKNGAGLGLSMVKWIVEAHKGKIDVQSLVQEGTLFTITLPISD